MSNRLPTLPKKAEFRNSFKSPAWTSLWTPPPSSRGKTEGKTAVKEVSHGTTIIRSTALTFGCEDSLLGGVAGTFSHTLVRCPTVLMIVYSPADLVEA